MELHSVFGNWGFRVSEKFFEAHRSQPLVTKIFFQKITKKQIYNFRHIFYRVHCLHTLCVLYKVNWDYQKFHVFLLSILINAGIFKKYFFLIFFFFKVLFLHVFMDYQHFYFNYNLQILPNFLMNLIGVFHSWQKKVVFYLFLHKVQN